MKNVAAVAVMALAITGACSTMQAQDTKSADKSFLADSAQDSLAEINFAKLALEKSQDKNIREFATRMIHDHEMLIDSMKPFVAKLNREINKLIYRASIYPDTRAS